MQERDPLNLPEKFTRTISGMFGEDGKKWLAGLPGIVDSVAENWSLTVGKRFENLSYHFVAPCICPDKTEAILKIGFPGERLEFFNEVKTLRLYDGNGAVRLLKADKVFCAMLLEKLTPGEGLGKLCLKDDAAAVEIAAGILKKIVRKAPSASGFHLLDNWINGFRKAEKTDFPAETIQKARSFYQELSGKDKQKFLLHGDFHHENILSSSREPYLLIDPKGLIGDIGYDVGVFLNNHRDWLDGAIDLDAKLARAAQQFSTALDITAGDLRKWAFIQMVLSAWWTFEENDEKWRADLRKAEIWQV